MCLLYEAWTPLIELPGVVAQNAGIIVSQFRNLLIMISILLISSPPARFLRDELFPIEAKAPPGFRSGASRLHKASGNSS